MSGGRREVGVGVVVCVCVLARSVTAGEESNGVHLYACCCTTVATLKDRKSVTCSNLYE